MLKDIVAQIPEDLHLIHSPKKWIAVSYEIQVYVDGSAEIYKNYIVIIILYQSYTIEKSLRNFSHIKLNKIISFLKNYDENHINYREF